MRISAGWLIVVIICLSAGVAQARPALLAESELDGLRGGFVTVDGITFDFGAVLRASVDGVEALRTQISVDESGTVVTHVADVGTMRIGEEFIVDGALGRTVLFQGLENGRIVNGVLNTADLQMIRQDSEISLVLPGFAATQRIMALDLVSLRLSDDIGSSFRN